MCYHVPCILCALCVVHTCERTYVTYYSRCHTVPRRARTVYLLHVIPCLSSPSPSFPSPAITLFCSIIYGLRASTRLLYLDKAYTRPSRFYSRWPMRKFTSHRCQRYQSITVHDPFFSCYRPISQI